ncbi:fibronectin type III domain-containing protein [Hydrogenimonas thermophila]|nr:fibronectin type III domain-containing protein [Hydrogenimonas thermophila]
MKFWIQTVCLTLLMVAMGGCAGKNLTSKTPKVAPNLPPVTSIKTLSDLTSVGFEWKMVPSQEIEGYHLYRLEPGKEQKLKRVATIADRYSSHYVDTKLKPGQEYVYQMSTYNKEGFESKQSEPVRVRTKPVPESVSFVRAIANLPKRVKLIWRPHQNSQVSAYIIERAVVREPNNWTKIATVENRLSAEYMDKDLKDGEVYIYRVRVKLCNGIITGPSTAVKAITKPLPLPPMGLHATIDKPKKIHLEWQPSPTKDVVYYKVYRSPFSSAFYSYRAKTDKITYDDIVDEDGKIYYYKVTAVDKDGLESPISEVPVMGSTLSKPATPTITDARVVDNHAILRWNSNDKRTKSYVVVRNHWEGLIKRKREFINISKTDFMDTMMQPGTRYTYRVMAVDKYGIRSEPSEPVELFIEDIH